MQICAFDNDRLLIFAAEAERQQDYYCTECNAIVRLRSGTHRQAHFYHLGPNGVCRQHAKGMPHLMLQCHLRDLLPPGEATIEHRFASIGRIADVAWHPRRIVYEIQYSPIRPEEVLDRNAAYASVGYQVVWILHDVRYNKTKLSQAEHALLHHPHYFSDMDASGKGKIYDQFSLVEKGFRTLRFPPLTIDPVQPLVITTEPFRQRLPEPLRQRIERWGLGFDGDTVHTFHKHIDGLEIPGLTEHFSELERLCNRSLIDRFKMFLWKVFHRCAATPYRSILRLMLERACR